MAVLHYDIHFRLALRHSLQRCTETATAVLHRNSPHLEHRAHLYAEAVPLLHEMAQTVKLHNCSE